MTHVRITMHSTHSIQNSSSQKKYSSTTITIDINTFNILDHYDEKISRMQPIDSSPRTYSKYKALEIKFSDAFRKILRLSSRKTEFVNSLLGSRNEPPVHFCERSKVTIYRTMLISNMVHPTSQKWGIRKTQPRAPNLNHFSHRRKKETHTRTQKHPSRKRRNVNLATMDW